MQQTEQYWLFAAFCCVVATLLLRLVLRKRITIQSSLWVFFSLAALVVLAVVPNLTSSIAHAMGFTLPSNFFFAIATGALALLHVHTLVTLSRTELRSITLTQELGLLREKLDRVAREEDTAPPAIGGPPAGRSPERADARHERT
jgi:hypothetical protein